MKHRIQKFLPRASCVMALFLFLIPDLGAPVFSAQQRVDPVQANKDARQATQNLNRDVNNDIGKLQRSTRTMNKLENELEAAKRSADKATDAAHSAVTAAQRCDEDAFKRYAKEARDAQENFKTQKDRADNTELDLMKEMNDAMNDAKKRTSDIQNTIDAGVKAATDAGLPTTSVTFGNLANAQGMLNNELAKLNSEGTKAQKFKDEGSLHKLNKAKSELDTKLEKIKQDNKPAFEQPEQYVDEHLKWGEEYIKANCPKKVVTGPQTATDVYVALNNQEKNIIGCEDRVMTPEETRQLFGDLGGGEVLTNTGNATMISTTANLQTIERTLGARGLSQRCFVEKVVCLIMTPLTSFRGHNHEDHVHSGRADHDHHAPDPPWDWGVTPPETVIRCRDGRCETSSGEFWGETPPDTVIRWEGK